MAEEQQPEDGRARVRQRSTLLPSFLPFAPQPAQQLEVNATDQTTISEAFTLPLLPAAQTSGDDFARAAAVSAFARQQQHQHSHAQHSNNSTSKHSRKKPKHNKHHHAALAALTGCSSLDCEDNPSSLRLAHPQIPVLQPCPTQLVIPDTANNFLRPGNPTTWTSAADLLSN
eukprot:242974-Rhodomonas_salina.1